MNQDFILGKLGEIMRWDLDKCRDEFAWIRLMSKMKFDGYQDFRAGVRFVESLVDWLQQFPPLLERETAYSFVRQNLVYVSPGEINHLVELLYPTVVEWRVKEAVADRFGISHYRVWADPKATALFHQLLRQTLFIELSDGARIDVFRHTNAGLISNEQVVTAPRLIKTKWNELLKDLRSAQNPGSRFSFVFLIDDFVGSGTTLLRWDKVKECWAGKLAKFHEDLQTAGVLESHFEPDWVLCVHHYISTHQAKLAVEQRQTEALTSRRADGKEWFERVRFSQGIVLPENAPLDVSRHGKFLELVQKYYDDAIESKHMKVGGDNARLGFSQCGLPLVLEHNTPNNSVALLWAETDGGPGKHAMRPLFRRRQRHT